MLSTLEQNLVQWSLLFLIFRAGTHILVKDLRTYMLVLRVHWQLHSTHSLTFVHSVKPYLTTPDTGTWHMQRQRKQWVRAFFLLKSQATCINCVYQCIFMITSAFLQFLEHRFALWWVCNGSKQKYELLKTMLSRRNILPVLLRTCIIQ